MATLQVLIPLDGSEFSRQILPQVRRLFGPERYAVRLLRVVPPPGPEPLPGPALVGPDMTLYSYSAGFYGAATAGATEFDTGGLERHAIYDRKDLAELREGLERELDEDVALFRRDGYEVSATVHFGDPVEEIVGFSEGERVDVVAMASHGRTGLGKFLLGSVAQDVFQHCQMPVLMLRVQESEGGVLDEAGSTPLAEEAS